MKPVVSIICIAYNQERFIGQTLDSFLMQKTDFPFEVIIHDDASTDKTAEIIRSYAEKHPKIIKPILETENQYSKGPYDFINDMLRSAKGDYLAFCEGDDYWTDDQKLQLQVDFLNKHQDYGLCFHPVEVIFDDNTAKPEIFPDPAQKKKFTLPELLQANFIQTNSVMYRRQDYRSMPNDVMPHDWFLHLYHAQFGKIGFIDRVMSVYRRHAGGVWWEASHNIDKLWIKQGLAHLRLYKKLLEIYADNPAYRQTIYAHINTLLSTLLRVDEQHNEVLVASALKIFPEGAEQFMRYQYKKIETEQKEVQRLTKSLEKELDVNRKLTSELKRIMAEHSELAQKHGEVVNSKAWQYVTKARKLKDLSKGRKAQ